MLQYWWKKKVVYINIMDIMHHQLYLLWTHRLWQTVQCSSVGIQGNATVKQKPSAIFRDTSWAASVSPVACQEEVRFFPGLTSFSKWTQWSCWISLVFVPSLTFWDASSVCCNKLLFFQNIPSLSWQISCPEWPV